MPKFKSGLAASAVDLTEEQIDNIMQGGAKATAMQNDKIDLDEWMSPDYRDFNTLIYTTRVLTPQACNEIQQFHFRTQYYKDDEIEELNQHKSYKRRMGDNDVCVMRGKEKRTIVDIVNPALPEMMDFGACTDVETVNYPAGTYVDFGTDQEYRGICIFTLNDNYRGGRYYNEPGALLDPPMGSMIAFNNVDINLHGMEPVYDGDLWVLKLYFKRITEAEIEELANDPGNSNAI